MKANNFPVWSSNSFVFVSHTGWVAASLDTTRVYVTEIIEQKRINYTDVTLNSINLLPEKFQNRFQAFSRESVDRIKSFVKDWKFRWEQFDPLIVWKNPNTWRLYILAWHSRFQSFQELVNEVDELGQKYMVSWKDFSKIPVRVVYCSESEALEIAAFSNVLSTKETDEERARYYREMMNQWKATASVRKSIQLHEWKNAQYIEDIMSLNPKGWTFAMLKSMSVEWENRFLLKQIAQWIGSVRSRFPELSDMHEEELLNYLKAEGVVRRLASRDNFHQKVQEAMYRKKWKSPVLPINEFIGIGTHIDSEDLDNEILRLDILKLKQSYRRLQDEWNNLIKRGAEGIIEDERMRKSDVKRDPAMMTDENSISASAWDIAIQMVRIKMQITELQNRLSQGKNVRPLVLGMFDEPQELDIGMFAETADIA
jgi:hypothetical protein